MRKRGRGLRLAAECVAAICLLAAFAGCKPEGEPKPAARAAARFCESQQPTRRGTAPFVAVCGEAGKLDCVLAIAKCGARAIGPLPPDALLVETSAVALEKLRADSRFREVRELRPEDKVAAGFAGGTGTVSVLTGPDVALVSAFVAERGGELLGSEDCGRTEFRATLTPALVGELSRKGEVRGIR